MRMFEDAKKNNEHKKSSGACSLTRPMPATPFTAVETRTKAFASGTSVAATWNVLSLGDVIFTGQGPSSLDDSCSSKHSSHTKNM